MSSTVLLYAEDLFTAVQIRDTAAKTGDSVTVVQRFEDLLPRLSSRPLLVLIDLAAGGTDWPALGEAAQRSGVPLVAFGNHMDLAGRERALAAGAEAVLANSLVATDLVGVLRKYTRREATAGEGTPPLGGRADAAPDG